MFLIIGGNGPCSQMVADAAESCPNIHYLGYVHPSQVPLYTACADIIFYGFDPSNPNARFSAPNKLFEGLAAGKIILTADFGEIGRIVKETKSGIILEDYSVPCLKTALKKLAAGDKRQYQLNSLAAGKNIYNLAKANRLLCNQYRFLMQR